MDRSGAQLVALCAVVERLSAAGETVTERALRAHLPKIGCGWHDVPKVVLDGLEAGVLTRSAQKVQGGGKGPLTTLPGWQGLLGDGSGATGAKRCEVENAPL